jgi:hypothetical protein
MAPEQDPSEAGMLTAALVTRIRTEKLTDTHWARMLRISPKTVRHARIGLTYRHVSTPPDIAPRDPTGVNFATNFRAKPARIRRQW